MVGSGAYILGIGALYTDTILTVPSYPEEDSKLRATSAHSCIGGNIINTFEVLSDAPTPPASSDVLELGLISAVGSERSCKHVEPSIQSRVPRLTSWLVNRPVHGTANAYIMCSTATGSRTIISHGSDIADPDGKELWDKFILAPRMPEWIHIEGRNCSAARDFLIKLDQVPWTGTVSVDFERPREGLREFISIADVLFISETYATALTEGMGLVDGDHESLFHAVIDNISQTVKNGASGHLLLGSVGSYSFCKIEDYDMKARYLERLRTKGPKPLSTGSIGNIVYARFEPLQLKAGEVVESIGAGDTFIAGVIWAMLSKWSWIDANLFATMIAGQKCTGYGFKRLWTSNAVRGILEHCAAQAGADVAE